MLALAGGSFTRMKTIYHFAPRCVDIGISHAANETGDKTG